MIIVQHYTTKVYKCLVLMSVLGPLSDPDPPLSQVGALALIPRDVEQVRGRWRRLRLRWPLCGQEGFDDGVDLQGHFLAVALGADDHVAVALVPQLERARPALPDEQGYVRGAKVGRAAAVLARAAVAAEPHPRQVLHVPNPPHRHRRHGLREKVRKKQVAEIAMKVSGGGRKEKGLFARSLD